MTLLDLFHVIKRRWFIIVIAAVVCAGGAFGYVKMQPTTYCAKTYVYTMNYSTQVWAKIDSLSAEASGSGLKVNTDTVVKAVLPVAARGADPQRCIEAVNAVCEEAVKWAREMYLPKVDRFWDDNGNAPKTDEEIAAEEAENLIKTQETFYYIPATTTTIEAQSATKYLVVGLCGGLLLGLCIVLGMDLVRRPLKGRDNIEQEDQEYSGIKVLGVIDDMKDAATLGRIMANVSFALPDKAKAVTVVPLQNTDAAARICNSLANTVKSDAVSIVSIEADATGIKDVLPNAPLGLVLICCPPNVDGLGAAFASRDADATIIVARLWKDSMRDYEKTVGQLKDAHANIIGVILVGEKA